MSLPKIPSPDVGKLAKELRAGSRAALARAITLIESRRGDHIWWISDLSRFQEHYPNWKLHYDVPRILQEIYEMNVERWSEECLNTERKPRLTSRLTR